LRRGGAFAVVSDTATAVADFGAFAAVSDTCSARGLQ